MNQATYPMNCHNNSVNSKTNNQAFLPWRHLNSKDYANYVYKWCKLVKINRGIPNDWGNWGIQDVHCAGMKCAILEITNDLVLVEGVEQVGPNQAVQSTTLPIYVWSRYLRPFKRLLIPRLVQWTHFYDHPYLERKYLKIGPPSHDQDFEIVQGTFMTDLEHSNFHQILDARGYAKYVYKWGELVTFGRGNISDTGNWGMQEQFFNFRHDLFVVLSVRASFVLITKAATYRDAIAEDPFFQPFWTWSRLLRLYTRLEFPRSCDWNHPWEPEKPSAPQAGYHKFSGPQNEEE